MEGSPESRSTAVVPGFITRSFHREQRRVRIRVVRHQHSWRFGASGLFRKMREPWSPWRIIIARSNTPASRQRSNISPSFLIKALDLLEVQRVPVRTRLYGVRRQRFLIVCPVPGGGMPLVAIGIINVGIVRKQQVSQKQVVRVVSALPLRLGGTRYEPPRPAACLLPPVCAPSTATRSARQGGALGY